jgi:hypothetical protein
VDDDESVTTAFGKQIGEVGCVGGGGGENLLGWVDAGSTMIPFADARVAEPPSGRVFVSEMPLGAAAVVKDDASCSNLFFFRLLLFRECVVGFPAPGGTWTVVLGVLSTE